MSKATPAVPQAINSTSDLPARSVRHDTGLDDPPPTEFGRRLVELRRRIIASGRGLSGREELEREIADRRGGASSVDET